MANNKCDKCGDLCDDCREQLLDKVREIVGVIVAEAVRISTGKTGNQWFTIPPAPENKREPKQ